MSRRTAVGLVVAAALAFPAGCSQSAATSPDGGAPRALDQVSPGSVGLAYQKTALLQVRYRSSDGDGHGAPQPIAGAEVRFGIFDDPEGSTLSRDRAVTDGDGVASVQLTAGAAEASFSVVATADNAPAATFHISVSNQAFVELDAALATAATVATFEAVLYDDRSCAQLPPEASAPMGLYMLSTPATPPTGKSTSFTATLAFTNLLSVSYAVLGRGLDAGGHLVAQRCADVSSALVPPGSTSTVQLPLDAVLPSPVGKYALTTVLGAQSPAVTAPWHALTSCPLAPAQQVLDATQAGLSSSLAAAVAGARGAVDGAGCRPQTAGAGASLDAQLQPLLTAAGSPGARLPAIVADLDGIVGAATLDSKLTLTQAGAGLLTGEHALAQLTLGTPSGAMMTYDLVAAGLPVIDARDVVVVDDPTYVTIGPHGFTLGLPVLWGRALGDLALAPRNVTPPSSRGLWGAVVGAAARSGKTGCAAVEDLICTATGAPGCAGNVEPACTAALDALAATLDAGFAPPTGIDVTLQGTAVLGYGAGDLLVQTLNAGHWTPSGLASASFTGRRAP
ncbi:MAG TPA: hypothetical protein VFF06_00510 [Polyangia bacterium]|nr:hypothetical protein [Polyangia bacterium]